MAPQPTPNAVLQQNRLRVYANLRACIDLSDLEGLISILGQYPHLFNPNFHSNPKLYKISNFHAVLYPEAKIPTSSTDIDEDEQLDEDQQLLPQHVIINDHPLFYAVYKGEVEIVKSLLVQGHCPLEFEMEYKSKVFVTPLSIAISQQNYNMVQLLIDYGADCTMASSNIAPYELLIQHTTPLLQAIALCDIRLISILLLYTQNESDNNNNPNGRNSQNNNNSSNTIENLPQLKTLNDDINSNIANQDTLFEFTIDERTGEKIYKIDITNAEHLKQLYLSTFKKKNKSESLQEKRKRICSGSYVQNPITVGFAAGGLRLVQILVDYFQFDIYAQNLQGHNCLIELCFDFLDPIIYNNLSQLHHFDFTTILLLQQKHFLFTYLFQKHAERSEAYYNASNNNNNNKDDKKKNNNSSGNNNMNDDKTGGNITVTLKSFDPSTITRGPLPLNERNDPRLQILHIGKQRINAFNADYRLLPVSALIFNLLPLIQQQNQFGSLDEVNFANGELINPDHSNGNMTTAPPTVPLQAAVAIFADKGHQPSTILCPRGHAPITEQTRPFLIPFELAQTNCKPLITTLLPQNAMIFAILTQRYDVLMQLLLSNINNIEVLKMSIITPTSMALIACTGWLRGLKLIFSLIERDIVLYALRGIYTTMVNNMTQSTVNLTLEEINIKANNNNNSALVADSTVPLLVKNIQRQAHILDLALSTVSYTTWCALYEICIKYKYTVNDVFCIDFTSPISRYHHQLFPQQCYINHNTTSDICYNHNLSILQKRYTIFPTSVTNNGNTNNTNNKDNNSSRESGGPLLLKMASIPYSASSVMDMNNNNMSNSAELIDNTTAVGNNFPTYGSSLTYNNNNNPSTLDLVTLGTEHGFYRPLIPPWISTPETNERIVAGTQVDVIYKYLEVELERFQQDKKYLQNIDPTLNNNNNNNSKTPGSITRQLSTQSSTNATLQKRGSVDTGATSNGSSPAPLTRQGSTLILQDTKAGRRESSAALVMMNQSSIGGGNNNNNNNGNMNNNPYLHNTFTLDVLYYAMIQGDWNTLLLLFRDFLIPTRGTELYVLHSSLFEPIKHLKPLRIHLREIVDLNNLSLFFCLLFNEHLTPTNIFTNTNNNNNLNDKNNKSTTTTKIPSLSEISTQSTIPEWVYSIFQTDLLYFLLTNEPNNDFLNEKIIKTTDKNYNDIFKKLSQQQIKNGNNNNNNLIQGVDIRTGVPLVCNVKYVPNANSNVLLNPTTGTLTTTTPQQQTNDTTDATTPPTLNKTNSITTTGGSGVVSNTAQHALQNGNIILESKIYPYQKTNANNNPIIVYGAEYNNKLQCYDGKLSAKDNNIEQYHCALAPHHLQYVINELHSINYQQTITNTQHIFWDLWFSTNTKCNNYKQICLVSTKLQQLSKVYNITLSIHNFNGTNPLNITHLEHYKLLITILMWYRLSLIILYCIDTLNYKLLITCLFIINNYILNNNNNKTKDNNNTTTSSSNFTIGQQQLNKNMNLINFTTHQPYIYNLLSTIIPIIWNPLNNQFITQGCNYLGLIHVMQGIAKPLFLNISDVYHTSTNNTNQQQGSNDDNGNIDAAFATVPQPKSRGQLKRAKKLFMTINNNLNPIDSNNIENNNNTNTNKTTINKSLQNNTISNNISNNEVEYITNTPVGVLRRQRHLYLGIANTQKYHKLTNNRHRQPYNINNPSLITNNTINHNNGNKYEHYDTFIRRNFSINSNDFCGNLLNNIIQQQEQELLTNPDTQLKITDFTRLISNKKSSSSSSSNNIEEKTKFQKEYEKYLPIQQELLLKYKKYGGEPIYGPSKSYTHYLNQLLVYFYQRSLIPYGGFHDVNNNNVNSIKSGSGFITALNDIDINNNNNDNNIAMIAPMKSGMSINSNTIKNDNNNNNNLDSLIPMSPKVIIRGEIPDEDDYEYNFRTKPKQPTPEELEKQQKLEEEKRQAELKELQKKEEIKKRVIAKKTTIEEDDAFEIPMDGDDDDILDGPSSSSSDNDDDNNDSGDHDVEIVGNNKNIVNTNNNNNVIGGDEDDIEIPLDNIPQQQTPIGGELGGDDDDVIDIAAEEQANLKQQQQTNEIGNNDDDIIDIAEVEAKRDAADINNVNVEEKEQQQEEVNDIDNNVSTFELQNDTSHESSPIQQQQQTAADDDDESKDTITMPNTSSEATTNTNNNTNNLLMSRQDSNISNSTSTTSLSQSQSNINRFNPTQSNYHASSSNLSKNTIIIEEDDDFTLKKTIFQATMNIAQVDNAYITPNTQQQTIGSNSTDVLLKQIHNPASSYITVGAVFPFLSSILSTISPPQYDPAKYRAMNNTGIDISIDDTSPNNNLAAAAKKTSVIVKNQTLHMKSTIFLDYPQTKNATEIFFNGFNSYLASIYTEQLTYRRAMTLLSITRNNILTSQDQPLYKHLIPSMTEDNTTTEQQQQQQDTTTTNGSKQSHLTQLERQQKEVTKTYYVLLSRYYEAMIVTWDEMRREYKNLTRNQGKNKDTSSPSSSTTSNNKNLIVDVKDQKKFEEKVVMNMMKVKDDLDLAYTALEKRCKAEFNQSIEDLKKNLQYANSLSSEKKDQQKKALDLHQRKNSTMFKRMSIALTSKNQTKNVQQIETGGTGFIQLANNNTKNNRRGSQITTTTAAEANGNKKQGSVFQSVLTNDKPLDWVLTTDTKHLLSDNNIQVKTDNTNNNNEEEHAPQPQGGAAQTLTTAVFNNDVEYSYHDKQLLLSLTISLQVLFEQYELLFNDILKTCIAQYCHDAPQTKDFTSSSPQDGTATSAATSIQIASLIQNAAKDLDRIDPANKHFQRAILLELLPNHFVQVILSLLLQIPDVVYTSNIYTQLCKHHIWGLIFDDLSTLPILTLNDVLPIGIVGGNNQNGDGLQQYINKHYKLACSSSSLTTTTTTSAVTTNTNTGSTSPRATKGGQNNVAVIDNVVIKQRKIKKIVALLDSIENIQNITKPQLHDILTKSCIKTTEDRAWYVNDQDNVDSQVMLAPHEAVNIVTTIFLSQFKLFMLNNAKDKEVKQLLISSNSEHSGNDDPLNILLNNNNGIKIRDIFPLSLSTDTGLFYANIIGNTPLTALPLHAIHYIALNPTLLYQLIQHKIKVNFTNDNGISFLILCLQYYQILSTTITTQTSSSTHLQLAQRMKSMDEFKAQSNELQQDGINNVQKIKESLYSLICSLIFDHNVSLYTTNLALHTNTSTPTPLHYIFLYKLYDVYNYISMINPLKLIPPHLYNIKNDSNDTNNNNLLIQFDNNFNIINNNKNKNKNQNNIINECELNYLYDTSINIELITPYSGSTQQYTIPTNPRSIVTSPVSTTHAITAAATTTPTANNNNNNDKVYYTTMDYPFDIIDVTKWLSVTPIQYPTVYTIMADITSWGVALYYNLYNRITKQIVNHNKIDQYLQFSGANQLFTTWYKQNNDRTRLNTLYNNINNKKKQQQQNNNQESYFVKLNILPITFNWIAFCIMYLPHAITFDMTQHTKLNSNYDLVTYTQASLSRGLISTSSYYNLLKIDFNFEKYFNAHQHCTAFFSRQAIAKKLIQTDTNQTKVVHADVVVKQ